MKTLTVYCDKDLVFRWNEWPDQLKQLNNHSVAWENAANEYAAALELAKRESKPFEDQKEVTGLVRKYNTDGNLLWGFKPDTFYSFPFDGEVEVIIIPNIAYSPSTTAIYPPVELQHKTVAILKDNESNLEQHNLSDSDDAFETIEDAILSYKMSSVYDSGGETALLDYLTPNGQADTFLAKEEIHLLVDEIYYALKESGFIITKNHTNGKEA